MFLESMELLTIGEKVWVILDKLNIEEILEILFIILLIAAAWPIVQAYLKVYDITLINQLGDSCKFSLHKAWVGDIRMRSCEDEAIESLNTKHMQVVPSWRGMIGSYTIHLCVKMDKNHSVDIPIYNSGDLQRTRTFIIQSTGVREYSTPESDMWTWCADHSYGQTS